MTKLILMLAFGALLTGCGQSGVGDTEHAEHAAHDNHSEGGAEEVLHGPHGGRLLVDGDVSLEVAIVTTGGAPVFQVYSNRGDTLLAPSTLKLTIALKRFGGEVETHTFAVKGNYLVSTEEVSEPHSFDVTVAAEYEGKRHQWTYTSYEDRTTITAEMAVANRIETAVAGSGVIKERVALFGSIQPDATRVRAVTARYPGILRRVDAAIGDHVSGGQTLATVESNESLQTYTVTAPIAGTVVQRHANVGEATAAEPLFDIADYSRVWAVLNVFPRDRSRLRVGQTVTVQAADGAATGSGIISGILADGATQPGLSARIVLDNTDQRWTPNQFINGAAIVSESTFPVTVPIAALQSMRDTDVVFLNKGTVYQAQPVEVGARDNEHAEIKQGIAAGATIVTRNAYLIKANIEKSSTAHED